MKDIEFWSISQLQRASFVKPNHCVLNARVGRFPFAERLRALAERLAARSKKRAAVTAAVLIFACLAALFEAASLRAAAQTDFRVDGAGVEASPSAYNGPCPGTIKFAAKIQANGAGRVKYTWLRSDGATGPVEYLDFTEPGVRSATTTWTLGDAAAFPSYSGWQQIKILSPNERLSNKAEFSLVCSQSGGAGEKKIEQKIDEKKESSIVEKVTDAWGKTPLPPQPDGPDCRNLPNGCPPEQVAARFRITINGFRCNRRTNDKFLDEDGAKDELFLRTDASLYDMRTNSNQPLRQSPVIGDSNTRPDRIRAGRATSIGGGNGGFEDGDGFPSSSTPWVRVSAPSDARPPLLVWEGELVRDGNALALIPSIWESDENSRILFNQWTAAVAETFAGIGGDMRQAIARRSGSEPSDRLKNAVARFFDNVRIPNAGNNDLDRPLGMEYRGGEYGFNPHLLVLTYDAAERLSRTDSGFGEGIVPITFRDQRELVGDYTVFAQIERIDGAAVCAADLPAVFSGSATMSTSHPNARGPFTERITLDVNAANCRETLSITRFPGVSATFPTPVGDNTATITLIGGGTGSFNAATGRLEVPVRLRLANTNAFGGVSTIEMTLSTEAAGAARYRAGAVTLIGSGVFRGGFLDGQTGTFTINGVFAPQL